MTRKSKLNTTKSRSIFALAVSLMLSCILLLCTACGSTDNSDKDKDYSKTENDTAIITNGSFEYGTTSFDLDDYPQTSSISGWSGIATENSSDASKVSSGVVNTTDDAWKELVKTLYKDSDFKKYAENKWTITGETDEEKQASILTNFPSPKTHDGESKKVLMLNNYTNYYKDGSGTAQKTTSSTTVTLEKGEFGKLSVWVKTANLQDIDGNKGGANIRLINTFNSSSQADYAIYGIDTNGVTDNNGWKQYTIYIKGDANYNTTFKVVLGLGFGNGKKVDSDWTEGTAFFDDVVFEEIDEVTYTSGINGLTESKMNYNGKDDIYSDASTDSSFAYDMTFTTPATYFESKDLSAFEVAFTTSTTGNTNGYDGDLTDDDLTDAPVANKTADQIEITLDKASVTVTTPEYSVEKENYNYVSFAIKNELGDLDVSGITVYVIDFKGDVKNVTSALTFTEDGEEKVCGIMIKNNFEDGNARTYKLQIVIGPTNIDDRTADNYANGTVIISDFKIAKGLSYQYVKDASGNPTDDETENYKFYSFYSGIADKSVALYAGNNADYSETTNNETFTLSPSPSSYGKIVKGPVNVNGYLGIETNSSYLKHDNPNHTIDKRSGAGDNGNYAGLINTKYIAGYTQDVKDIIGTSLDGLYINNADTNKNVQPLMIYNATAGAYGYIGKTLTVSPSSYAKVSVDIRIIGDAKAYIYLVDAFGNTKNVMTFDAFKVNTNGYDYVTDGKDVSSKQLAFELSADNMDGKDWVTATFYIATGATEKKFRLEVWNGGRDGATETASQGLVYFNNISVSTSGAFSEYAETDGNYWTGTFNNSSSVLNGLTPTESELYKRVLDETEIAFNKEYSDKAVAYKAKYVWVKSDDVIYAVYNSLNPVVVNPYDSITEEDDESGCTAKTDPSTFWLSFSTILLGVALALAIIMLIVKNVVRKRKANASDAKSHFKVTSRVSNKKEAKKDVKVEKAEEQEQVPESAETESEEKEEVLDDYVYGDVQDFGENEEPENKE